MQSHRDIISSSSDPLHRGTKDKSSALEHGLGTLEFMLKRFIDDHAIERIELINKNANDLMT